MLSTRDVKREEGKDGQTDDPTPAFSQLCVLWLYSSHLLRQNVHSRKWVHRSRSALDEYCQRD